MHSIKILAPAKINLTLEIIKKIPNGYHQLRSVITKLPHLRDEITIKFNSQSKLITITGNSAEIPLDNNNLCFKAAKLFFQKTKKEIGLDIKIKKNIPVSAGLAGGSTNAAAVLKALNNYFNKPLSQAKLAKLSSKIGKDVPFFFTSKNTALVENMGEKITEEITLNGFHFLIINPKIKISTPLAYKKISQKLWFMSQRKRVNLSRELIQSIENNPSSNIAGKLYNDFELVTINEFPIILEIKQALLCFGALASLMSGSGSSVFGIFDSKIKLECAKKMLKCHYPNFFIAEG